MFRVKVEKAEACSWSSKGTHKMVPWYALHVASNEGQVADRLEQECIEAYYPRTIGESREGRPCTWAAITSRTSWLGELWNDGAALCAIVRRPTHTRATGWGDYNA